MHRGTGRKTIRTKCGRERERERHKKEGNINMQCAEKHTCTHRCKDGHLEAAQAELDFEGCAETVFPLRSVTTYIKMTFTAVK